MLPADIAQESRGSRYSSKGDTALQIHSSERLDDAMIFFSRLLKAFLVFTSLTTLVDSFFSITRSQSFRMKSVSGFSDPNWNWGSSNGTGHDAAMAIRQTLGTKDRRREFVSNLDANCEAIGIDDIKLALALRFQRASHEGIIGSKEGNRIMRNMAALKYENAVGEAALLLDLNALIDIISESSTSNVSGTLLRPAAAKVLDGMRFCDVGI